MMARDSILGALPKSQFLLCPFPHQDNIGLFNQTQKPVKYGISVYEGKIIIFTCKNHRRHGAISGCTRLGISGGGAKNI